MGYVFMSVALLSWTGLAFSYRWSDSARTDRTVMTAMMGITGTALVAAYIFGFGIDLRPAHPCEWIFGAALGVIASLGIPFFLAALSRGDISITWTIMSLSFAVAAVAGLLYPGEPVTSLGVTGLVVAAAAMVLLGLDMYVRHRSNGPGKPRKGWWLFMSVSFLTNGASLYCYKLAEAVPKKLGAVMTPETAAANTALFQLMLYAVFAALSLAAVFFSARRGAAGAAVGIGAAAGSTLCVGGFFAMFALQAGVPSYVLFPAVNGGTNVLVAVLSVVFLGERPGKFGWAGLLTGTASFVLLGLAALPK